MSQTVAVTGAGGRIGRSVVAALRRDGYQVRGIDREAGSDDGAVTVLADLTNSEALVPTLEGAAIVVHLAALMSWQERDAAALFETNVTGTFHLLEAARAAGGADIVLASSGEVYPESAPRYLPITEEHPTEPRSHYGMTKLLGEQMAWFYARRYGLPTTVLRLPHTQDAAELLDPDGFFSGPRFFLRPKLDQQRRLGNNAAVAVLEPYNDGTERLVLSRGADGVPYLMPICDTRDTVAGILAAVATPAARGKTIALGPPESMAFDVAVPRISALTGLGYIDVRLPGAALHYSIDLDKAHRILGFTPVHGVERILDEGVRAYRQRASAVTGSL